MIERISAGSNLTIEYDRDSWRLLANGDSSQRVLVEAAPGQPLRYVPGFGSKRKLPDSGELNAEHIQQVVLGWSAQDRAWHLGLVLGPALAQARGSRWCEVASWNDPMADQHIDEAAEAGRQLAGSIARPFNLIEAQVPAAPPEPEIDDPVFPSYAAPTAAASTRTSETPALPTLPLRLDLWTLAQANGGLELTLTPAWGRSRLLRVAWYIVWAGVFTVLALATITSGIALPRPEFLPYLGIAAAALLILLIFNNLLQVARVTNRIEITPRGVRGLHGKREQWHSSVTDIDSLYVSQIVSKFNKQRAPRSVHYGELILHLKDKRFKSLLVHGAMEEKMPDVLDLPECEDIVRQSARNAYTDLQAGAVMIAEALTVPCWYDQRVK